jgi:hypothetical protein
VIRLDTGAQQIHVTLDQHSSLAGTSRRFEHDVARRIDGRRAGVVIR